MYKTKMPAEMRLALARAIDLVIEEAGSVSALAEALGITFQAVSSWSKQIPAHHVIAIEALTGIRREVLRPDLYLETSDRKRLVRRPRQPRSREVLARRAVL